MVSSPYKTIDEEKVPKVGVREIKNIQHQLNYINKVLSIVFKAVERIKNPGLPINIKNPEIPHADPNQPIFQPNSFDIGKLKDDPSDILSEINKRLAYFSINKDSEVTSLSIEKDKLVSTNKNHYSQPSPSDLGWDDLHHERHSYDRTCLVTWNIDGYSEAQMMNMFQEMLLAASAYSIRKTTLAIAQIIISGFTGNLRSWWHNQLTEQERCRILTATKIVVKQEGESAPRQEEEPDMVNLLVYTMTKKKRRKSSSKRLFSKSKSEDPEFPRRKRKYYNKNKSKNKYSSKANATSYKCNRKGHYSNHCPGLKEKINALIIDEETRKSLLHAIRSKEDDSSQTESFFDEECINILNDEGSSSEEAFFSQSDLSDNEGAISYTKRCTGKCSGHINVITKDQETLFHFIDQLPNENSKQTCLLKLRQSIEEQNSQGRIEKSPIIYSYQDILNRIKGKAKKPVQVEDLHSEVKILTREVANNSQ
ncbi:polyprotein [Cucumis melo var. makuwa]|nr:polyprotein [Cucumis melo var. makuwa]